VSLGHAFRGTDSTDCISASDARQGGRHGCHPVTRTTSRWISVAQRDGLAWLILIASGLTTSCLSNSSSIGWWGKRFSGLKMARESAT
jgi:hypothetical protein